MPTTTKLKIFHGATPEVGQPAAGFVLEWLDDPFAADTFVHTDPIDSVVAADGVATSITVGETNYELERVSRNDWMILMNRLDQFRQVVPNVYQPD